MNSHWFYVGRDVAHALWFMAPPVMFFVLGADYGRWSVNKDRTTRADVLVAFVVAVPLYIALVVGYLEGWNVK